MSLFGKKSNFRTNNVEFVKELMEDGECGPFAQIVILTAIEKYCDQVLANKPEFIAAMTTNVFNGEAWIKTCEQIKCKVAERFQKAGAEVAKIITGR